MTKKLILPALAMMVVALSTTNSLGQCTSGINVQYVAVGSSAQFNSFAFAAEDTIQTQSGYTSPTNFWASSSEPLTDFNANVTDTAKVWIAWDSSATCYVYAYFSVDSTIGIKDFFSWHKITQNGVTNADAAAVYVNPTGSSWTACSGVVNVGQPACAGEGASTGVPSAISTFLTTQPGPTCKIGTSGCTSSTAGALPAAYCSQTSTSQTSAKYCFFNAAHADIRAEDTLYANSRALSSYVSTGGLAGLGYNDTACGANSTATVGCAFYESFGKGGTFNVVKFALSGTDPIGGATLPTYTELPVGAAPVVVIASDADSNGLGAGAPSYQITNVNRAVLAGIENGTFGCTGDLRYDGSGAGVPLQILHREALSGTYNTFEFTGVRQMEASSQSAISDNKQIATSWFTSDDSGQEQVNENQGGPGLNYGTCGTASTPPSSACGDPMYASSVACGSNGSALHLRVIGTGEMVKVVAGTNGNASGSAAVPDAFGYAFWSYGNLAPMASGCATNTGAVTCSGYVAHYLTVDGIDPLFTNPGDSTNPNGAYHAPQCYLKSGLPVCQGVPFTHIYDGSYPLWTILRLITFNNTSSQKTPAAVLQMYEDAEEVAGGTSVSGVTNLDDFVPYYNSINKTANTADLNLFVLRSHFKATGSGITPNNGIAACAGTYTGIAITGAIGSCTIDAGNDMGGAIITVNADAQFHDDFNGIGTNPSEYFGLHN